MRLTDRHTADTVLNIPKSVEEPPRMLQRVAIVISEQKTDTTIFMNLRTIQCAIAPARSKTSLLSGAPTEQLTFYAMLEERRNIEEETCVKRRKSRNGRFTAPPKNRNERPKIRFSCKEQVMHYNFHAAVQY